MIYIGTEANNIEDQPLDITKPHTFVIIEEIKQKIFNNNTRERRKIGISKRELSYLKKNAKEGKLNFNTKNVRIIIAYYSF